jgi:hypothetical protein
VDGLSCPGRSAGQHVWVAWQKHWRWPLHVFPHADAPYVYDSCAATVPLCAGADAGVNESTRRLSRSR